MEGHLELVRILNRLGAVASLDTVNRLATYVVEKRLSEGIKPDLNTPAVSIDILQSYAFVSCQDATRSWHGTSVQCVQPLPISGHLTADDCHVTPVTGILGRKHPISSPIGTPIPVEKRKRRRRTLTEHASPHTAMVTTTEEHVSNSEPFHAIDLGD